MDTKGWGGKTLKKGVSVVSNDPEKPRISLMIKGEVEIFAKVTPEELQLMGPADAKIKGSVIIEPAAAHPFSIVSSKAANGANIRCDFKEQSGSWGKRYVLTVENIKRDKGRYFDLVTLKTDDVAKPEIQVKVYGVIMSKKKG